MNGKVVIELHLFVVLVENMSFFAKKTFGISLDEISSSVMAKDTRLHYPLTNILSTSEKDELRLQQGFRSHFHDYKQYDMHAKYNESTNYMN